MPLTKDRTALFIHVPKCAGTSMEVAMGYGRRYPTLGESRTVTTPDYEDLFGGGLQYLTIREVIEKLSGLFDPRRAALCNHPQPR